MCFAGVGEMMERTHDHDACPPSSSSPRGPFARGARRTRRSRSSSAACPTPRRKRRGGDDSLRRGVYDDLSYNCLRPSCLRPPAFSGPLMNLRIATSEGFPRARTAGMRRAVRGLRNGGIVGQFGRCFYSPSVAISGRHDRSSFAAGRCPCRED